MKENRSNNKNEGLIVGINKNVYDIYRDTPLYAIFYSSRFPLHLIGR